MHSRWAQAADSPFKEKCEYEDYKKCIPHFDFHSPIDKLSLRILYKERIEGSKSTERIKK